MSVTQITMENFTEFPVGSKVEFNFGAMYPRCVGKIVAHEVVTASKFFPASARLIAEYFDPTEEKVITTTITQFCDTGIGAYLLEKASIKTGNKSPWNISTP
jgi:hypothetical protein